MESKKSADPVRKTLYVVLFALTLALAYLVGMHEERGRQNRRRAAREAPASVLRP